jgi:hypothetical protein
VSLNSDRAVGLNSQCEPVTYRVQCMTKQQEIAYQKHYWKYRSNCNVNYSYDSNCSKWKPFAAKVTSKWQVARRHLHTSYHLRKLDVMYQWNNRRQTTTLLSGFLSSLTWKQSVGACSVLLVYWGAWNTSVILKQRLKRRLVYRWSCEKALNAFELIELKVPPNKGNLIRLVHVSEFWVEFTP